MASANLNFITFNQDHSCLAVGMCPCYYDAAWPGPPNEYTMLTP